MHENTERFREFVFANTAAAKDSHVADKIAMPRSTYYSAINAATPVSAELVIRVCSAYGVSVLEGLKAAHYIGEEEVTIGAQAASIEVASDSAMLSHLLHRAMLREQDKAVNVTDLDTKRTQRERTFTAPDLTELEGEPYAAMEDGEGRTMDGVQDQNDGA